jgi:hypothetical protein
VSILNGQVSLREHIKIDKLFYLNILKEDLQRGKSICLLPWRRIRLFD